MNEAGKVLPMIDASTSTTDGGVLRMMMCLITNACKGGNDES